MGEPNFDVLVHVAIGAVIGWVLFHIHFFLWWLWQMWQVSWRERVMLHWYALRTWWLVRREGR